MRLQAALLPPPHVQDDLAAAVASVAGSGEQLTVVPPRLMHLGLARFGNVSHADGVLLERTLQRELLQWSPMTVRFQGGTVLEPLGDDSAWARLEGDTGELVEIADLTIRVVKRLGFLVDRRLPRTVMRLGRITPATNEAFLQRLLDRLEGYVGPEWTCSDIALLHMSDALEEGPVPFEVQTRFALEGHDVASQGAAR
jgi:2'-5' RNA ligase